MKRLVLGFIIANMLLNYFVVAQENTQKYYKVKIIQENPEQKGWGTFLIRVGEFIFDVIANAVADTDSVKKIARDVENYVNNYGLDQEKVAQEFRGKLKIHLIKKFQPRKDVYHVGEEITFDIALNQKVYIYLLDISKNDSCLIFPNAKDSNNIYNINNIEIPANSSYVLKPNEKGRETLYLIASLRPIFFDSFKAKSIYSCSSRNIGLRKISKIKNKITSDVSRVDLIIK